MIIEEPLIAPLGPSPYPASASWSAASPDSFRFPNTGPGLGEKPRQRHRIRHGLNVGKAEVNPDARRRGESAGPLVGARGTMELIGGAPFERPVTNVRDTPRARERSRRSVVVMLSVYAAMSRAPSADTSARTWNRSGRSTARMLVVPACRPAPVRGSTRRSTTRPAVERLEGAGVTECV
jgi:hypothetical protein